MSDGQSSMRPARLAAWAALLGALLGAAIPGVFLLTATDRQLDSEANRSVSEFLRLQRQAAYAEFATDGTNLYEFLSNTINVTLPPGETLATDCAARIEGSRRYEELRRALVVVELIGSAEPREKAKEFATIFSNEFARRQECVVDGNLRSFGVINFTWRGQRAMESLEGFLEAARQDLTQS